MTEPENGPDPIDEVDAKPEPAATDDRAYGAAPAPGQEPGGPRRASARLRIGAVALAVATVAAGGGLVWAADRDAVSRIDLTTAADRRAAGGSTVDLARELTCPGPDRTGVPGVADPKQQVQVLSAVLPWSLQSPGGSRGSVGAQSVPGEAAVAGVPRGAGETASTTLAGAQSLVLRGEGALGAGLSAVQANVERSPSVRGLSTVVCSPASARSWLVGGGSAAGRSERLVLTNPTAGAVSARVAVLGSTDAARTVVVPAHGRSVVVPGGADQKVGAPVISVSTRRGPLGAALVDAEFAGAVPRGVDVTGPSLAPTTKQTVPAVVAAPGGSASMRVAVPGREAAVVRVSALGPGNVADVVQTIPAGQAKDIPLSGLASGHYALRIESDVPVVAAAQSRTAAAATTTADQMWSPAAAPLKTTTGTALPKVPGGKASVLLSAPDGPVRAAVTVRAESGALKTTTHTLDAGDARSVAIDGSAVWVEPVAGAPSAAVVLTGKDGAQPLLSAIPLQPAGSAAQVAQAQAAQD